MIDQTVSSESATEIRILVVDDDLQIRSATVRALELVGYKALEAESGETALALLAQETFDLIVLDLKMPGLSGVNVMQQARQMQPNIQIVILTGHADLESAIAAVKMDAVDYLQKPVSMHKIVEVVNQSLQKRSVSSQRDQLIQLMDQALGILRKPSEAPTNEITRPAPPRFMIAVPLKLDRVRRVVSHLDNPDHEIMLTKGEASVLASLMTHPNQVYSCQELVQIAWGYDVDRSEAESIIRPYIFRIRNKLADALEQSSIIVTIRGGGYMFVNEAG